jgi:hypothetical protein
VLSLLDSLSDALVAGEFNNFKKLCFPSIFENVYSRSERLRVNNVRSVVVMCILSMESAITES